MLSIFCSQENCQGEAGISTVEYTDLFGLHSSESLSNVWYNVSLHLLGKVEFTFPRGNT